MLGFVKLPDLDALRIGGAPRRTALRAGSVVLLGCVVANCAGPQATGKRGNKYGVAPSPRVIAEGQPVPKGGGREMTGKPYVVGGRTYKPHGGPGYDKEGWASWYGSAFHGRLTANGEVFDRGSVAAAHPTLPLPSYVRVTNTTNKRSMIVRVNDRGPYEYDRVIDVSEQVADALGFKRSGVSRVRVQYVGRASIHGSDDRKLLATLRTDGAPAPAGDLRGRTMLASLKDEAAPASAAPRAAFAQAEPVARSAARLDRYEPASSSRTSLPSEPVDGERASVARSASPALRSAESSPLTPSHARSEERRQANPAPLPITPPERVTFAEIY